MKKSATTSSCNELLFTGKGGELYTAAARKSWRALGRLVERPQPNLDRLQLRPLIIEIVVKKVFGQGRSMTADLENELAIGCENGNGNDKERKGSSEGWC